MSRPLVATAAATSAALLLGGCEGIQSVLAPESLEARRIAGLAWLLLGGGAAIFAVMLILTWLAMRGSGRVREILSRQATVIGGGLVFPMITLAALLGYGFVLMSAGADGSAAPPGQPALRVSIVGERWWWRVVYGQGEATRIASANEIRIPVGRPVTLELTTQDVIHSFWVPSLAGKVDMIPGRTNTLRLTASRTGRFRGQCAEYCGGAHALMSFFVLALPPAEFEAWLENERLPAHAPASPEAQSGQRLFLANGCGACHTVRGTAATGIIGPDLTHIGSRTSIAAATLPATHEALARWIAFNQAIKPENLMPPFLTLSPDELALVATYLEGLK